MIRNVLLSGGPQHEFDRTSEMLADLLEPIGIGTTIVQEPADAAAALRDQLGSDRTTGDLFTVNALRWDMGPDRDRHDRDRWSMRLDEHDAAAFEHHVTGGGGLIALHTSVICFDGHPTWRPLIGAAWDWERSDHPPIAAVEVQPTPAGRVHPVTAGTAGFTVVDELYRNVQLEQDVVPLLTGSHEGGSHPVLWAREHGRGRTVTCLLGHDAESLAHPSMQTLLSRAAAWALRLARSGEPCPT